MTCQSLFGAGEGLAAGVEEDFGEAFEDLEEDFDFAKQIDERQRQSTPAMRRKRDRVAFILNRAQDRCHNRIACGIGGGFRTGRSKETRRGGLQTAVNFRSAVRRAPIPGGFPDWTRRAFRSFMSDV